MAQWLRSLTVLAKDAGSVPSTHTGQLTSLCNFSSRDSNALFHREFETTLGYTEFKALFNHINEVLSAYSPPKKSRESLQGKYTHFTNIPRFP